jgi:transcriptional regulator with XRE-family HTH domain
MDNKDLSKVVKGRIIEMVRVSVLKQTQTDLASAFGISRSYLSRIEEGKRLCPDHIWNQFAFEIMPKTAFDLNAIVRGILESSEK